ncbi:MAG: class I SAM-dependent methyltransferase [Acidobacteria bacterium]|nr:class I SAM-dependent methyltransferase [Acidobacteriota bacterium]
MKKTLWPENFVRIPQEDWAQGEVELLALKYDTVENHGWYSNLARTVSQIGDYMQDGHLLLDYSGGTGILAGRLLEAFPEKCFGVLIVDSSPKFLRLALEKFRHEDRVALRLIRYRKEQRRLDLVDEVLDPDFLARGADGLACTNAIHLYYDLPDTLAAWHRVLKSGARVFIQSGNIRNPEAGEDEWIIDETVEHIHLAAMEIVREEERFVRYRPCLEDREYMRQHDALRQKYFLPVKLLSHYVSALQVAGLPVLEITRQTIEARVDEWFNFLAVYHEGVVGWLGGARKLVGREPADDVVRDRFSLMRLAMERVFAGKPTFKTCWTYLVCERSA